MTIDQSSFEPVYRQLARILREQIRSGELRPGATVGSEASLAQRFGVGRDAVRDALAAMRGEGLVITNRGVGTFVRGPTEEVQVLQVGAGTRVSARVPTEDELTARYADQTGRDMADLKWFTVLACFKLGAILEGTYARACAGKAPKATGDNLHASTIRLFTRALARIDA